MKKVCTKCARIGRIDGGLTRCPKCGGTGDVSPKKVRCPRCDGTGRSIPSGIGNTQLKECEMCSGTGYIWRTYD